MSSQTDNGGCPEIETIFEQLADGRGAALDHARDCPRCSAILEEHRQLEKDLFRLADPMPPPDFVQKVMVRVQAAPLPLRRELRAGLAILVATFVAIAGSLVASDSLASVFGVKAAGAVVALKELFIAIGSGVSAVWATSAVPVTCVLLAMLAMSLVGLRRLVNSQVPSSMIVEGKVS